MTAQESARAIEYVDKQEMDYYALVIRYADGGQDYVTEAWTTAEADALATATAFLLAKDGHEGFVVEIRS